MNDYEKARGEWLARPNREKTWDNFKLHFTEAYVYLLRLRGPTMRNTSFQQHANAITQQILAAVQQDREADKSEIFNKVSETERTILSAMSMVPQLESEDEEPRITPTPSVALTTSDKVQLKMLALLEKN